MCTFLCKSLVFLYEGHYLWEKCPEMQLLGYMVVAYLVMFVYCIFKLKIFHLFLPYVFNFGSETFYFIVKVFYLSICYDHSCNYLLKCFHDGLKSFLANSKVSVTLIFVLFLFSLRSSSFYCNWFFLLNLGHLEYYVMRCWILEEPCILADFFSQHSIRGRREAVSLLPDGSRSPDFLSAFNTEEERGLGNAG